uniref:Transforming growth factor beta induced protein n=1 Tax=Branchiostoma belcheri TaxID=7741 RepID=X2FTE9_BRABE|nr:transforming growth factor beta induced protein [Branchiostoma belcheri]
MRPLVLLGLAAALQVAYAGIGYNVLYQWSEKIHEQGPNVCAVEEVSGTKKQYWTNCRTFWNRQICERQTIIRYECCTGYGQIPGEKGCTTELPLKNIPATLEDTGADTMLLYTTRAGLTDQLENEGAFTVFAPSNEAWAELPQEVIDALVSNVNVELRNALLYHMAEGVEEIKDFSNDRMLRTLYRNSPMRINNYGDSIYTVNCGRILRPNQRATNGIVHIIDKVVTPTTGTIDDFVSNNDRFATLRTAITAAGLSEMIQGEGPFTLFAPTNEAFNKIPPETLNRILGDADSLDALLKYHILDSGFCSAFITRRHKLRTMEGSRVNVSCGRGEVGDEFRVNQEVKIVESDIVTDNGIIHVIDSVLIPNAAKNVAEMSQGVAPPAINEYLSSSGIIDEMAEGGPWTILAPTDQAFEALPADVQSRLATDTAFQKEIIGRHIVEGQLTGRKLIQGQDLRAIDGDTTLRTSLYRKTFCIDNACAYKGDHEANNGAVILIDRVLMPAEGSLWDLIDKDGSFSTLKTAIQTAGLVDVFKNPAVFTVFAPTNEAFENLPAGALDELLANSEDLANLLQYHVIGQMWHRKAMRPNIKYRLPSVQGEKLELVRAKDEESNEYVVTINGKAKITQGETLASNGLLHVIDQVLVPGQKGRNGAAGAGEGEGNNLISVINGAGETVEGGAGGEGSVSVSVGGGGGGEGGSVIVGGGEGASNVVTGDGGPRVIKVTSRVTLPGSGPSIWDSIDQDADFSILKSAISTAQLEEMLDRPGTYTFFAPTDRAFNALPENALPNLLANPEQLSKILEYHVVENVLNSKAVSPGVAIPLATLQGGQVTVRNVNGVVTVNSATVERADLINTNGIIHVIDKVLIP